MAFQSIVPSDGGALVGSSFTGWTIQINRPGLFLFTAGATGFVTVAGTVATWSFQVDGVTRAQRSHFFNPASTHLTADPVSWVFRMTPGAHSFQVNFTGVADVNDNFFLNWIRIGN